MLTYEQLKEIKSLQFICEAGEDFELKLNWDMLRKREEGEANDFFHYSSNGLLVGFLALYDFGNKVEICGMVHPQHRRKGIFSDLFSKAIQVCKERQYDEILLNAPANSVMAKKFFESLTCNYANTEYQMKWFETELIEEKDVRIRPSVTKADLQLEVQLDVCCFGFSEGEAVDYNNRIRRENDQQFYIIEFEEEAVGKIRVSHEKSDAWIYGFAILPEHQGKGIGRKALKKIVLAEHQQGKNIFLDVEATNNHALKLYESCGFQSFHAQDYYRMEQ
ncbi:GNAT family N-acetyltransferase [Oceanobacillus chungangensis]|uniref:N-acetyltransferase n=1 Tax=Oceanobacillus chungangensis TaxID=1229152 RepID=A0A3D8PUB7_9BACI|nr:GNAT family N-acetyltransferase [Oceanobacillus chungangensis]RDW19750.1 N-acetyltransferase [Oceanobacillus chungangensis]